MDMSGPGFDEVAEVARGRVLSTLFELLGRLHWTGPTLEEHRTSALAEMLTFAGEHSTWHAERLGTVDPAGVTPNDLSALPTMTKADLMANWDGIVTDPRLSLDLVREHLARVDREGLSFLLDEYVVLTTGGSTGEPGIFAWSLDELSRWAATNARTGRIRHRTARWQSASGCRPRLGRAPGRRSGETPGRTAPRTSPSSGG